jgi:hypothetical protein
MIFIGDPPPPPRPLKPGEDDVDGPFEWIFGLMGLVLGPAMLAWLAFFYGAIAYRLLILQVKGVPIYLVAGAACLVLALSLILFFFRDVRNWRSAALIQILVAVAAGVGALFVTDNILSQSLAILVAAVAASNGIARFVAIARAASKENLPGRSA